MGAAPHASRNTERTIVPGMLLVMAHAQCLLEWPSWHQLLRAPHGRRAAETTIPSVPRGACACVVHLSAILTRVNAVAAATKQTRARHWRPVCAGVRLLRSLRCTGHGRAGGSCSPPYAGWSALGRGAAPFPGRRGFAAPLRAQGSASAPARRRCRSARCGETAPAAARSLSLFPQSRRGPSAAGSGRSPAPRAREGQARSARVAAAFGRPCRRPSPPPVPRWKLRRRQGFCSQCPPPLSCRSLPSPSSACPARLRLPFFFYYPRCNGEMRPLSPPSPESRFVGIEVFLCLAYF